MRQRTHPHGLPEWRNAKIGHLNAPKHVAGKMVRRGNATSIARKISGWKGKIPRALRKLGKPTRK